MQRRIQRSGTAVPPPPGEGRASSAQRAYAAVRRMAMDFELRPGERLGETELAERLQISRTPLREALNRLTAEGLLVALPQRGFAARELDPQEVFELYEARAEVEGAITRLAAERARDQGLADLEAFLRESVAQPDESEIDHLMRLDVGFHQRLARLAGNAELTRILENLNDRIHFMRWINMEGRRRATQSEHLRILELVQARDAAAAVEQMRRHISLRQDQIIEMIRKGYAHIYTAHLNDNHAAQ
ncbi:GntR family transcriptional regulator [Geminicoccaceae bacterium 1502E]|nr:GntR family transcriptional regulator [Geminicoccaceae bacterium 1502E]